MTTCKLAVIGCGNMQSQHQAGLALLADRLEVVATVDIDRERAKRAATVLGAATWATDYREVLDDVDAVLVALPHHLHHPVGMDLLRAGKHVLMEKPLANTEQECRELIDAAAAAGLTLMTAYLLRYHPLVVRLKQLLDEGRFGEVFQMSIWAEQFTAPRPIGSKPDWLMRAATAGGGELFDHGSHYVDLLLWFLGAPVRGTHIGTNLGTPWVELEGTSNVTIEFSSGALGYHFGTWGARGTRQGASIQAHGTAGMVELDLLAGELRAHREGAVEVIATAGINGKWVQGELAHFVDCVRTGARPQTDGPRSLQSLRVIWRLYAAERAGTMADLRGLDLA